MKNVNDIYESMLDNLGTLLGDSKPAGCCKKLLAVVAGGIYDAVNQQVDLKVLRTDDAKQFELIRIKKDGDVGFDIAAVLPYDDAFIDHSSRMKFMEKYIKDNPNATYLDMERKMRKHITIWPGERGTVPTGIRLEIPRGYWASIEARSSTSKMLLDVPKGVIDEGYRGEIFAVLINVGHDKVRISHGDRLVQLIVHKRYSQNINVVEVDKLSESERGDSGFGSTGTTATTVRSYSHSEGYNASYVNHSEGTFSAPMGNADYRYHKPDSKE